VEGSVFGFLFVFVRYSVFNYSGGFCGWVLLFGFVLSLNL